ncbi:Late Embryogenesis Abundant 4-5 [Hibiscus trionum]|uniref:Late Embryogenesis Abundant 4-5 n=1 Tax=Hibiscus trionum TaxID=183268 RepID=A0A9W7LIJ2_HIBTR|nr:Late Embryogenesis Abundant 4-5 [Hibiscus trionum]
MQPIKETAANVAASAKSGLEKTKATVEEKMEKATSHDQSQKEMATERKQERIHQAELDKHNAAAKNLGEGGGLTASGTHSHSYSTTGEHGQSTGGGQKSALPGHGSGQPAGKVVEGRAVAHPVGLGGTASHNTRVEGNPHGYGTGGTYS